LKVANTSKTSSSYKAVCKPEASETNKVDLCATYKTANPDDTDSAAFKVACPDGATNVTAFAATMAAAIAALAF